MSIPSRTTTGVNPRLVEGEQLDRATFHQRYESMPADTRAELIGGVVHMPSPVGREHGRATVPVIVWLSHYEESTPGVETLDNASVFLNDASEPQPDALLRILPVRGGQTRDKGTFIEGPPELVVEVAHATRAKDLGEKLADYERAGVLEYVVSLHDPEEVQWHARQHDKLIAIQPDPDGIFRSRVFPGLWLDSAALLRRDQRRLREVVDRGLATPDHTAFVSGLRKTLRDGIRQGRVVGLCRCGHSQGDHEHRTMADLPDEERWSQADPDRPAEVIEAYGMACSRCACDQFCWVAWELARNCEDDYLSL